MAEAGGDFEVGFEAVFTITKKFKNYESKCEQFWEWSKQESGWSFTLFLDKLIFSNKTKILLW